MSDSEKPELRHVCIHGHFYQPPRENPWLEEVEQEESANPYHNWNQRINSECYRANGAARQVDEKNRILSLHNNYGFLSFNFGPTLLRWIERNDPWLHQTIVEADRESCLRMDGHGNAMAQVYNHLIMPLANGRDRITQVLWGRRDFEERFRRKPEGMWLAETAVNRETLEVLADAGIRFTVLSPFQALRWRFLEKGASWNDASGGTIPSGRAYRYICGNGKSIDLFFYDAALARGIAFENDLQHGSRLIAAIHAAHDRRDPAPEESWLVNTATDGESYGHHYKFGDMALAAALGELDRDPGTVLTNYGAFLASVPVRAEVEIIENSSWSCSHGVGRWREDCGCHIGGSPGWNQKWRAPLREALDRLRDVLALHYEREMGRLCHDPWKARDEYIEVLLDRDRRGPDFLSRHLRAGTFPGRVPRFYQLLEMQRCTLYMFTSCGWFFDEISGIESVLILRYAARAMQLAEQTGAASLEGPFLEILKKAPGNTPEYPDGAQVYLRKVKPEVVGKDRVAASYAIQALIRSSQPPARIHCFSVTPEQEEDLGLHPAPCRFSRVTIRDERTREEQEFICTAIHFAGFDLRCSVKPHVSDEECASILGELQASVEEQKTVKVIRVLDRVFGTAYFSLQDLFRDLRAALALEISSGKLALYTEFQRTLYQMVQPLILSLRQWGIVLPSDLRGAVRRVLSEEVDLLVGEMLRKEGERSFDESRWNETDFFYRAHLGRLRSILVDARGWGVVLQIPDVSANMGEAMLETLDALAQTFSPRDAGRMYRFVTICREVGIKPELWKLQTLYFAVIASTLRNPGLAARIQDLEGLFLELDSYLGCRFVRLLKEPGENA